MTKKFRIIAKLLLLSMFSGNSYATSIEDSLIATYNNNPEILAERESLKAADEVIIEALSGFLPQIQGEYNRSKNWEKAKLKNDDDSVNLYDRNGYNSSGQIALRQSIFNGGSDLAQVSIAKKFITSSRAKLYKTEQNVFLNAIVAHIEVLIAKQRLDIYDYSKDMLKKYLESVEFKFSLGEVTRTDVAQAKSRFAKSLSEYTKAQGALINAKSNYATVTGIDATNLDDLKDTQELNISFEDALNISLSQNYDITIAKITSEIESNRILQKIADFSPKVNVKASISKAIGPNYQYQDSFSKKILQSNKNKQITFNVEVPLYQRGLEYQALRKQKHLYQRSKNNLKTEISKITNNVTKIWEDIQLYNSVIKSSEEALIAATIALDGITQEAALGQRTTMDVLETEHSLMESKLSNLDARYRKIVNIYNLKAQFGKLTASSLMLETKIYDPIIHYNKTKFKIVGF